MAIDGHAPSTPGSARKLYALGCGLCPDCERALEGDYCPECQERYPIVGGGE